MKHIISSSSSSMLLMMMMTREKEDKEVRRPEHGKLAVLTGVISRSSIAMHCHWAPKHFFWIFLAIFSQQKRWV